MKRLVFLVEEDSMKVFLEELLPRVFPGLPFLCVAHEGKNDLDKSVPRKLRGWREPGVCFVVLRDTDSADCRAVKANLVALCSASGRPDTLIRVICQELEAWYFGDAQAMAEVFGDPALATISSKARYRDPDAIAQPGNALKHLVPSFEKVSGARAIGKKIDYEANTSGSFRALIDGVRRIWASCQQRGSGDVNDI